MYWSAITTRLLVGMLTPAIRATSRNSLIVCRRPTRRPRFTDDSHCSGAPPQIGCKTPGGRKTPTPEPISAPQPLQKTSGLTLDISTQQLFVNGLGASKGSEDIV